MGWFETIAVLDLQFRVVLAVAVVVFAVVGFPLAALLDSANGFLVGGVAGVLAAGLTARKLAS
jgi:hypothetical protein